VALVAQYAVRMRHIFMCLQNSFPYYLINDTIFEIRFIEHKMLVFIFSTNLSETFLILSGMERDMIKKYIGLHVKYSTCYSGPILMKL